MIYENETPDMSVVWLTLRATFGPTLKAATLIALRQLPDGTVLYDSFAYPQSVEELEKRDE